MSEPASTPAPKPKMESPPFIQIAGVHNFRDLGGYKANPHGSVKRSWIYRAAEPAAITEEGRKKLKELGVTTFYDLRSEPETYRVEARGDQVEIEGFTRVWCPVFATQDYSPEKLALRFQHYRSGPAGFVKAYEDILANGGPAYRTILLHMRDKPSEPFVMHCTAGKDRTGVLAMLILLLAGVTEETIVNEYNLTEIGLAEWMQGLLRHVSGELDLSEDQQGAINMLSAKKEAMSASLKMFKEHYGSAEEYMKKICQFTDEDIATIRKNLVVDKEACL